MMAKILTFMINFFMGSRKNELDAYHKTIVILSLTIQLKKRSKQIDMIINAKMKYLSFLK